MQVTVLNNQSLFDLAIQECGTVESAFELALKNGKALTDDLSICSKLELLPIAKKEIVNQYTYKNITPATALTQEDNIFIKDEGISIWAINVDFIVQ